MKKMKLTGRKARNSKRMSNKSSELSTSSRMKRKTKTEDNELHYRKNGNLDMRYNSSRKFLVKHSASILNLTRSYNNNNTLKPSMTGAGKTRRQSSNTLKSVEP